MRKVKYLCENLCSSLKKCSGKLFISVLFEQRCRRKVFLSLGAGACCPLQGSHTSGKMGKTWEFYSTRSQPGNALENRENNKNQEKPLKFFYWKSLDNIKLLPFDRCYVVPLQLRTSEFGGVSLVR